MIVCSKNSASRRKRTIIGTKNTIRTTSNVKNPNRKQYPKETFSLFISSTFAASFGQDAAFPCVDLKFEGNTSIIAEGEKRQGTLRFVDEDKFKFVEKGVQYVRHPELHWRLLERTKHGRASINAQHVKVEFYIRHDDYRNGRELADILASEIETMGETFGETDMEQEVSSCC